MNRITAPKQPCLFCARLKGHAKNIANLVPQYAGKKLLYYETDHFLVTAELHPVVKDPYFLVVPKKHYKAFSKIETAYTIEMDTIVKYLRNVYKNKKSYVIFEHGEVSDEKKAQSVYHAHSHIILTNSNFLLHIVKKMKENKMNPHILTFPTHSTVEEIKERVKDRSYLLFRQETIGVVVMETKKMEIPSQTFRRWMYDFENPDKEFLDWKKLDDRGRQTILKRLLSLPQELIIE